MTGAARQALPLAVVVGNGGAVSRVADTLQQASGSGVAVGGGECWAHNA